MTAYAFLTGATGAAAAAIVERAGTYLDVSTANDRALEEQNRMRLDLEQHTAHEAKNMDARPSAAGFTTAERTAVVNALEAHPAVWLQVASAVELQVGDAQRQSPLVQSLCMFVADLLAAAIPVIPFNISSILLANSRERSIVGEGKGVSPRRDEG